MRHPCKKKMEVIHDACHIQKGHKKIKMGPIIWFGVFSSAVPNSMWSAEAAFNFDRNQMDMEFAPCGIHEDLRREFSGRYWKNCYQIKNLYCKIYCLIKSISELLCLVGSIYNPSLVWMHVCTVQHLYIYLLQISYVCVCEYVCILKWRVDRVQLTIDE